MVLFLVTPCLVMAASTCMEWVTIKKNVSVYWLWHLLPINFLGKKVNKILTWPGTPSPTDSLTDTITHSLTHSHPPTHSLNYLEMMRGNHFLCPKQKTVVFINLCNCNFPVFSLQGSNYLFEVLSSKFILSQPYVGWIRMKTYSPTYFPSP